MVRTWRLMAVGAVAALTSGCYLLAPDQIPFQTAIQPLPEGPVQICTIGRSGEERGCEDVPLRLAGGGYSEDAEAPPEVGIFLFPVEISLGSEPAPEGRLLVIDTTDEDGPLVGAGVLDAQRRELDIAYWTCEPTFEVLPDGPKSRLTRRDEDCWLASFADAQILAARLLADRPDGAIRTRIRY